MIIITNTSHLVIIFWLTHGRNFSILSPSKSKVYHYLFLPKSRTVSYHWDLSILILSTFSDSIIHFFTIPRLLGLRMIRNGR